MKKPKDISGCYNTDVPLWAVFFRDHPDEQCTYYGDTHACEVWVMGEARAMFPDRASAMAVMEEARRQAKLLGNEPRKPMSTESETTPPAAPAFKIINPSKDPAGKISVTVSGVFFDQESAALLRDELNRLLPDPANVRNAEVASDLYEVARAMKATGEHLDLTQGRRDLPPVPAGLQRDRAGQDPDGEARLMEAALTHDQIELRLDAAEDQISERKGDVLRRATEIIRTALADGAPKYPDEIPALAEFAVFHPAVVGVAFRVLMKAEEIRQTGEHRRSTRNNSNGRVLWQYVRQLEDTP